MSSIWFSLIAVVSISTFLFFGWLWSRNEPSKSSHLESAEKESETSINSNSSENGFTMSKMRLLAYFLFANLKNEKTNQFLNSLNSEQLELFIKKMVQVYIQDMVDFRKRNEEIFMYSSPIHSSFYDQNFTNQNDTIMRKETWSNRPLFKTGNSNKEELICA